MVDFRRRRLAAPLRAVVVLFVTASFAAIGGAAASALRRPFGGATTTIASHRTTKAGVILVSSRGQVLFLFTHDRDGKSSCYGRCRREWRPLRAFGRVVAKRGSRVKQRWLSTTRRRGGTLQATYDHFPLYVNVGNKPGSLKGDSTTEFGGRWYAMPAIGVKSTSP